MFEKYLITGATGFLGRTVLAHLRDAKAEIRALVMEGDPLARELSQNVRVITGDVCDEAALGRFFAGADEHTCVIHCAGMISVATHPGDRIYRVNVDGTRNILKFCRQCGAARAQSGSMNYASSEGRSTEGGGGLKRPPLARETMPKPSLSHVVKPMTESHHSHTEASIFGREAKCEERYTEAEDAYSGAEQRAAYAVDMGDREKIIQGILYSEILSKPKALRK